MVVCPFAGEIPTKLFDSFFLFLFLSFISLVISPFLKKNDKAGKMPLQLVWLFFCVISSCNETWYCIINVFYVINLTRSVMEIQQRKIRRSDKPHQTGMIYFVWGALLFIVNVDCHLLMFFICPFIVATVDQPLNIQEACICYYSIYKMQGNHYNHKKFRLLCFVHV